MTQCKKLDFQPDLLALHQFKPDQYPYLLASNTEGQINTSFSILMAYPEQTVKQFLGKPDILKQIKTKLSESLNCSIDEEYADLPFVGGWFVYLSYEYAQFVETSVDFTNDNSGLPIAFLSRIPAAVIIDHDNKQSYVLSVESRPDLLDSICNDLDSLPVELHTPEVPRSVVVEEDADIYREFLKKTRQYIIDGDVFQANLSRLWSVTFASKCDPIALYRQLKKHNPAPFAALVKIDDSYLLSSSPERLISVKNGIAETRPIAGTHPRGQSEGEDFELAQKLLKHPKERAEHIMLIDLERNDLGRICIPGSITVSDKMTLETYQHVHHIVSSVSGKLKPQQSFKDVIHAVFPGGTITGCPKVRCMQIINELEQAARGAYTGSVGYISDHGVMDMNILIRTMTYQDNTVTFRAGAGIVIDSVTEKELNETRHKARGLLDAIQSDQ